MAKEPDIIMKKDMREAYLLVNNGGSFAATVAGVMVCFFVVIGIMGNLEEEVSTAFRPGGSLLTRLQLIAGAVAITSILVAIVLKVFQRQPKKFRVQTFRNPERLLYNFGFCALVCVGLFGGLRAIQDKDAENQAKWEQMEIRGDDPEATGKVRTKGIVISWLLGLPLVLGCGALLWWSGGIILSEARTYWQQVRLTAYFDKERYAPGEAVTVMLKDRQSFGSSRTYQLHLNYVREKRIQAEEKIHIARSLHLSKTWPVTAGQLHDGFRFALPDPLNVQEYSTLLNVRPHPCYWEILIEEADSHFYCRFFVNVS